MAKTVQIFAYSRCVDLSSQDGWKSDMHVLCCVSSFVWLCSLKDVDDDDINTPGSPFPFPSWDYWTISVTISVTIGKQIIYFEMICMDVVEGSGW